MNESHKSYSLQLLFVLAMVAFATMGCFLFQPVTGIVFTNVFTEIGGVDVPSTPEEVSKAWLEALFNVDEQIIRENTCESQRNLITDDMINNLEESLGVGIKWDFSDVTFTFNETMNSVTLGGNLQATISEQVVDVPMSSFPFADLSVINEGGRWFVCVDTEDLMGE